MGERPPSISPEIWQELQESKEAVKAKAAAGNGASEGSAPPKRAHRGEIACRYVDWLVRFNVHSAGRRGRCRRT
jgi:hypothetical protein